MSKVEEEVVGHSHRVKQARDRVRINRITLAALLIQVCLINGDRILKESKIVFNVSKKNVSP